MLSSSLLILLLSSQAAASCDTVEVCRAQALIAHAKADFESFHDFAWAAYRKGKPNDPELMLLIARAQSLSGRPGDALVMLERFATLGRLGPPEIVTDPDFARVRALPRWDEVREKLRIGIVGPGTGALPDAPSPGAAAPSPKPEPKPTPIPGSAKPAAPEPKKPDVVEPRPPAGAPATPKPPAPKPESPKVTPAEPRTPKADPAKPSATLVPPAPDPPKAPPAPARAPGASIRFETTLTPSALAYDRVSKRYIIGDRRARRLAVIDEHTGHVSTLVGAMGALGDVEGIAIDAQQGDLWVLTSGEQGTSLSKMQLISGRVLSTTAVGDLGAGAVALAFVPGTGLVAADANGMLWRIQANGRTDKLTALEYVPKSLGADGRGRLYVSAGGPRLARFAMTPFRKLGTIELDNGRAPEGPFVVVDQRLETIVSTADGYELRSTTMK